MMLSLVAPSLGEDSVAPPCIPTMQLVGLRSCLAFLTLSTVGAPSGAPALLREAQWVVGHGLSSELPTHSLARDLPLLLVLGWGCIY